MGTILTTYVQTDEAIVERVLGILRRQRITMEELALKTGIPKGTMDNISAGRVKSMKSSHLGAIIEAYPQFNAIYILTGEGEPIIVSGSTDPIHPLLTQANRALNELKP